MSGAPDCRLDRQFLGFLGCKDEHPGVRQQLSRHQPKYDARYQEWGRTVAVRRVAGLLRWCLFADRFCTAFVEMTQPYAIVVAQLQ